MISPAITSSAPPIIILGASTRAAAYSAVRAGFQPLCFDLFADLDTQLIGLCQQVEEYPGGLPKLLSGLPPCPAMYVGALENAPQVVNEISAQRDVWGVTGEVLLACRKNATLHEALRISRAPILAWRDADDVPPTDGSWMLRPLAGSGGQGILPWEPAIKAAVEANGGINVAHGFQQRAYGNAYSALFLASKDVGDVQFVGVTRQLIGLAELGAGPNIWCGNIGPATLPVEVEHLVRRVGNVLKWKCGLSGIYGLDFILDEERRPWITEVNPRYPASTEILEWAAQSALLWNHAQCFGFNEHSQPKWQGTENGSYLGKAIVYVTEDVTVSAAVHDYVPKLDPWVFPEVADLPPAGTLIAAGQPLCTVFATAADDSDCQSKLLVKAATLRAALTGT